MITGYLAGPIANCNDDECLAWRNEVVEKLPNIKWLNPMDRDARHYGPLSDDEIKWIVEGDKNCIYDSDIILANCWKPGWGTGMEIILAHILRLPVYSVVPEGKISPWIRYHSTEVFRSLDDAIKFIKDKHDN